MFFLGGLFLFGFRVLGGVFFFFFFFFFLGGGGGAGGFVRALHQHLVIVYQFLKVTM